MKSINVSKDRFDVLGAEIELIPTPVAQLNVDVVNKLRSGVAHFAFTKKDGTYREAYGTLNLSVMPASYTSNPDHFEKGLKRSSETSQSYFDLEAQDWRAYSIVNLVTLF